MKKILSALMCMFTLVFCACSSNNNANTTEPEMMDTTIVTGDTTTPSVIVDSTVIDTNLMIKK